MSVPSYPGSPIGPPAPGHSPGGGYPGGSSPSGNYPGGNWPGGNSPGGQPPLDWVSISALVSSLTLCAAPVSMVLGVVGVVRTKNGQRRGRWAAIAGLVISTLVIGMAVVALVAGGVFLAATSVDDLDPTQARPGRCIDVDALDFPNATSCTGEHDGEIIWVGKVTDATEREWTQVEYIDDFCSARGLSDPHAQALQDPAYTVDYWVDGWDWEPSTGNWMICYLTATEGGLDSPVGAPAG
jgi:hypothetical protein